jgi:hypothetical protein
VPALVGEHGTLGQQQRQQREALFALGAIYAQLTPVTQDRELIAVGSVSGEAALKIAW